MLRTVLISSCITGLFCAGFAFIISQIAPALSNTQVLATSFASGFFGSVVARIAIGK